MHIFEAMGDPKPTVAKQYDILLRAQHKSHRLLGNAAFDVARNSVERSLELDVPDVLRRTHAILKQYLGEHVPFPTVWIGTGNAKVPEDSKAGTQTTLLIGTAITKQNIPHSVVEATELAIKKFHYDNAPAHQRKKRSKSSVKAEQAIPPAVESTQVRSLEKELVVKSHAFSHFDDFYLYQA